MSLDAIRLPQFQQLDTIEDVRDTYEIFFQQQVDTDASPKLGIDCPEIVIDGSPTGVIPERSALIVRNVTPVSVIEFHVFQPSGQVEVIRIP